jgi:hypothetical protein
VSWTVAAFNSIISPAEKPFDLALNQVSITDERKQAVDFTSGYYTAAQTVITIGGSPIEGATTLADLADAKLGAVVGTTSLAAIEDVDPARAGAGHLRHQRRRQDPAAERPGRRHRRGPAHRVLHHRGRARRRRDRRPAPRHGRCRAGGVRHRAWTRTAR